MGFQLMANEKNDAVVFLKKRALTAVDWLVRTLEDELSETALSIAPFSSDFLLPQRKRWGESLHNNPVCQPAKFGRL